MQGASRAGQRFNAALSHTAALSHIIIEQHTKKILNKIRGRSAWGIVNNICGPKSTWAEINMGRSRWAEIDVGRDRPDSCVGLYILSVWRNLLQILLSLTNIHNFCFTLKSQGCQATFFNRIITVDYDYSIKYHHQTRG